jgi:GWxTD domain-containing protein
VKNLFISILFLISTTLITNAQGIKNRYIRLPLSEHCKALIIPQKNKQEVFIKISFEKDDKAQYLTKKNLSLILTWNIKNNPDDPTTFEDSIVLNNKNFNIGEDFVECRFETPFLPANTTQFLTLKFQDTENKQTFVMFDRITNTTDYTFSFYVHKNSSNFPLFDQYCQTKDTIVFKSLVQDSILVKHISTTESLALPPMYLGLNPYLNSNSVTNFKISPSTKWVPTLPGLYVFSYPQQSSKISIVVLQHKFPTFTKVKELINSLQYITSNDEQTSLLETNNQKEALDELLINLTGDQNLAKNIIKNYFKRVTEANKLFTTTKEGWKTDKGMIYIIFGAPDKVYFENGHEDWSYEKNPLYNELNFYFKHKLTSEGYIFELERLKDYQEIWIAIIEKWRKGLIK